VFKIKPLLKVCLNIPITEPNWQTGGIYYIGNMFEQLAFFLALFIMDVKTCLRKLWEPEEARNNPGIVLTLFFS